MRSRLQVLAIVVAVLIDLALVYLAVRHGRGVTSSQGPLSSSSSTPTAALSSSAVPSGLAVSANRVLVAAADKVVLRATRGSCRGGQSPVIEVSNDRGASFTAAATGLGVTEVDRVDANGSGALDFVGTDGRCRNAVYRSVDGGSTWSRAKGSGGGWHLAPGDPTTVHAPNGAVDATCPVVTVSPVSKSLARVLCDDGRVLGTLTAGHDWLLLGRLEGATSLSYRSPYTAYALASRRNCQAAVFTTLDAGATWRRTSCLPGQRPQAIALDGSHLLAVVDGGVLLSGNARTWTPP